MLDSKKAAHLGLLSSVILGVGCMAVLLARDLSAPVPEASVEEVAPVQSASSVEQHNSVLPIAAIRK